MPDYSFTCACRAWPRKGVDGAYESELSLDVSKPSDLAADTV